MVVKLVNSRMLISLFLVAICVSVSVQVPRGHGRNLLRRPIRQTAAGCPKGTILRASGMRAFLTISSLASAGTTTQAAEITQRQLELNWYNDVVQSGDWVGLFDHDPTNNPIDPLERVFASEYPVGYYRTSVMFPRPSMDSMPLTRQCLGFWIGYVRTGSTIAVDCIKTQPNWMWETRNEIAPLMYRELMVPGTHDAGSYAYYNGSESDNIFVRWVITQEENFWEQMMYGIRSFDLRIAYYSETPEKFWLNHSFVRVHPLATAIEMFKKFLNSTQEILLLDIHQFPVGFTNRVERHLELIEYLTQELGEYMLSPSVGYDVTVDTLWRSGKRVIVAYGDNALQNGVNLWRGIPQIWANTMDLTYLRDYIQTSMDSGRKDIWSAMAEFTSTANDVLFTNNSLRMMADEVNHNVTEWCRDLWWNEANVVAVDFFLGTNLVDVAIESNLKRKVCLDRYQRSLQQAQARERANAQQPPMYAGPRASGLW